MKDQRGLTLLLTSLPILTGWLYVIGIAYFQGYQAQYGIHYSFFEIGFEDALTFGLIALFLFSFPSIHIIALLLLLLATLLGVVAALSTGQKPKLFFTQIAKKFKLYKPKTKPPVSLTKATEYTLNLTSYVMWAIITLIIVAASIALAINKGRLAARSDMHDFQSNKITGIQYMGNRHQIVRCDKEFCILWDGNFSFQVERKALNHSLFKPGK